MHPRIQKMQPWVSELVACIYIYASGCINIAHIPDYACRASTSLGFAAKVIRRAVYPNSLGIGRTVRGYENGAALCFSMLLQLC